MTGWPSTGCKLFAMVRARMSAVPPGAQGTITLIGLSGYAADAGATIRSVEVVEPDLEAVFLHLTGKALRD